MKVDGPSIGQSRESGWSSESQWAAKKESRPLFQLYWTVI